jgi:tetratricopeptide (TPR) repeat protein
MYRLFSLTVSRYVSRAILLCQLKRVAMLSYCLYGLFALFTPLVLGAISCPIASAKPEIIHLDPPVTVLTLTPEQVKYFRGFEAQYMYLTDEQKAFLRSKFLRAKNVTNLFVSREIIDFGGGKSGQTRNSALFVEPNKIEIPEDVLGPRNDPNGHWSFNGESGFEIENTHKGAPEIALFKMARSAYYAGRYETAMVSALAALNLNIKFIAPRYPLSACYEYWGEQKTKEKQFSDAVKFFEQAKAVADPVDLRFLDDINGKIKAAKAQIH